jgi:hypothetical protein
VIFLFPHSLIKKYLTTNPDSCLRSNLIGVIVLLFKCVFPLKCHSQSDGVISGRDRDTFIFSRGLTCQSLLKI